MREGFDLSEELKKLPHKPGVYIMHDVNDDIIYVGKAVDLNNRVRSYFRANVGRGPWIDIMVSLIDYFEYIVTDSEMEALVLENNLIKEHHPKYNTMLMDDKTYPFIKVTTADSYPRILFSRELKKDKAKYFGPYPSAAAVKDTIELINKLYKLRTCNNKLKEGVQVTDRPCLNYHMGQCMAPCQGNITEDTYDVSMQKALEFLNGNYTPIIKELEQQMKSAAEMLDFEKAATVRDLLDSVKTCAQKQKITDSDVNDRDIVAAAVSGNDAVVQVFFIRNGRMIGREHFFLRTHADVDKGELISDFIKQYYAGTPYIPREIFVQEDYEDSEVVAKWLSERRGGSVRIFAPKKGQKEKLVELAASNAELTLDKDKERIKREEGRTIGAVKEICDLLGLKGIDRMEAFDISNTSGFQNVGSMVVFHKGKPKKSDYRKFRIKSVQGPNDYECMREVLTRRLGNHDNHPDLILMDGGKGQVGIALEVLNQLNLHIPVCGMVKDDHHRTRGLYYDGEIVPIDTHSEGFKLITRIQDEAHRFAITYHKSLRGKSAVHSVLDDIKGIGPARRKILMQHFESIEDIQAAGVDKLVEIEGISREVAESVYLFFHSEKE